VVFNELCIYNRLNFVIGFSNIDISVYNAFVSERVKEFVFYYNLERVLT